ncbi:GNAT family N-acetyltransferase [Mycolicibacterium sp. J2]|uniref:GNAT family N-acetyltransferase n=1 Tax=Mycolicibacterium sp. J2 TaxID=2993511 RepID=UPI00224AF725|nr:GNAT family N-acetyltransferase [Mycolicibacterium sp. J2]MCX2714287.1 GNAT family N-acetyltransferase [Mycolicibacterium sp. J2]
MDGATATVMAVNGARPVLDDVAAILEVGRRVGAEAVEFTLGPDDSGVAPGDISGAHVTATVDILAIDLEIGVLGVNPSPELQVDEVRTLDQFALYERTSAAAWGYPEPTDADIRNSFDELRPGWFLASLADLPVGAGGYTLVDEVARLWGAAVVPSARGKGVYRELIAARTRDAKAHGGTLGLVHAMATSSPVLQRVGFRKVGEQRVYRAACSGPHGGRPA